MKSSRYKDVANRIPFISKDYVVIKIIQSILSKGEGSFNINLLFNWPANYRKTIQLFYDNK